MKRLLIILGVLVVLAVIGLNLRPKDKAEATVEAGKVAVRDLTSVVNCSGTIQPKRQVDVSANAMGTIVHLAVVEGQMVKAGDLLLEIDPSEYRAAVQALESAISSARADLQLAEASLEQAEQMFGIKNELFGEGLASEEELIAARTTKKVEAARVLAARHRIAQTQANLDSARHDLSKVTISAPMTGVITRLNVEEGENAIMGTLNNPGTVLLVIADLGTMEAWVEVDETEVVNVDLGQPAAITIDAFPDQEFAGRVTEIGNSPVRVATGASGEAVDFEVKITLDGTLPNIRPGLSAKAEITVADRDGAVAVPLGAVTVRELPLKDEDIRSYTGKRARQQSEALSGLGFVSRDDNQDDTPENRVERKDTEGVFLIKDRFVKFVPVDIGIAGEDDFEILSGLEEGQEIVTGPFRVLRELKDGARIKIKSDKKKDKSDD
jgi:HlyD family secretion protein|nr:efflux RND transporter periplasmic adaptor subunit [Candidatus Krumholzibacteria bacterium]